MMFFCVIFYKNSEKYGLNAIIGVSFKLKNAE